jgi:hypothetical protein
VSLEDGDEQMRHLLFRRAWDSLTHIEQTELSELSSMDQPKHSFQAYAVSIEDMTVAAKSAALTSVKETMGMEYGSCHQ